MPVSGHKKAQYGVAHNSISFSERPKL